MRESRTPKTKHHKSLYWSLSDQCLQQMCSCTRRVRRFCFPGVVAGEEIGEGAAGADGAGAAAGGGSGVGGGRAGAGLGAAEVWRGRVVVGGEASKAFAEAEGAEAGDGDGGVAVAGGEAMGFKIGIHD